MIVTITTTVNRSVEISSADLTALMDKHEVPAGADWQSVADRLWDVFGTTSELTAALLDMSEVTDEDSEIDYIEDYEDE